MHTETMASGTLKHLRALPVTVVIVVLSLLFIHHSVVVSTISLPNESASHVNIYHPIYFEAVKPGSSTDFNMIMNSHQSKYASMHIINELKLTNSSYRLRTLNFNDDTYTTL